jgi:hypothetical protein
MAQPATQTFGAFLVELGNGATPELFTSPVGFTSNSLEMKSATGDTNIPDDTNPDLPSWTVRDVSALSGTISGQGVLATVNVAMWQAWFDSGAAKNIKVGSAANLANGGGYRQGPAVLTSFKIDATKGERSKITVQIDNSGAWPWTPATS